MKKITFILQSKGGVGKSTLTYVLANKYLQKEDTVFVDMDNESNTSSQQLSFVKKKISQNLIDQNTKNIDRSGFDQFFENFLSSEKTSSAVCDLGATTSEQFLVFIKNDGGAKMLDALHEMGIEVQICCVISGLNAFAASSTYCKDLFKALAAVKKIKKIIIKNNFFPFNAEQDTALIKLANASSSDLIDFNIVPNNVPGTLKEIHALMEQGKPISEAKTFTKIRIKDSIESLTIDI